MGFLPMGILYPADRKLGVGKEVGKLVLVKNRLPPSWTEDGSSYRFAVEPLLTEEEVRTGVAKRDSEPLLNMRPEQLGGAGCCDCCHRRGFNCGRKFPSLTSLNYMVLTPQLFNCLCRLGRSVSLAGMLELSAQEPPND